MAVMESRTSITYDETKEDEDDTWKALSDRSEPRLQVIDEVDCFENASQSANIRPQYPESDCSSVEEMPPTMRKKVIFRVKWGVIISFLIAAAVVATTTFLFTRAQEQTRFEERFNDDAAQIITFYNQRLANKVWSGLAISAALQSVENYNAEVNWPNVTLPIFDVQTAGHLQTGAADSVFWAPLLNGPAQRNAWSMYATQHRILAGINETDSSRLNRTVRDGIFGFDANQTLVDDIHDVSQGFSAPIWQIHPYAKKRHLCMFNLFSVLQLQKSLFNAMVSRIPFQSPLLDDVAAAFFLGDQQMSPPRSIMVEPILARRDGQQVTGFIGFEIDWVRTLSGGLNGGPGTTVVLQNSCNQKQTFELRHGNATYIGEGDQHDERYTHMKMSTDLMSFRRYWNENERAETPVKVFADQEAAIQVASNETRLRELGICVYYMDIYPIEDYENQYKTFAPQTYVLVVVAVFGCVGLLFITYDILVERRQNHVMANAAKSKALIKSLFPAVVRDRLFQNTSNMRQRPTWYSKRRTRVLHSIPPCNLSTNSDFGILQSPKIQLANFLSNSDRTDDVGGTSTAYFGDEPIAEMFSSTTVIFADIAGFTAWSSEREPSQVFKLLETIYATFDSIAKRLKVFKVETIGDCYVAVTGLPQPDSEHAITCARFACQCLIAMSSLAHELELTLGPGTSELCLRIGLHSGPVTAGVLRGEKSRFQLFGDTMNTASRMESTGHAGKIQVSEVTANLIAKAGHHDWLIKRKGTVAVKGKGEMQTWWLKLVGSSGDVYIGHSIGACSVHSSSAEDGTDTADQLSAEITVIPRLSMPAERPESDRVPGLDMRSERLIDWNVEVLMGFLEKVFQNRKYATDEEPIWTTSPDASRGLVIDEVVEVITLPAFPSGVRVKRSSRLGNQLPSVVRTQLKEFVTGIASMYRNVPFHNFEHASHVTMSANKLMKRIITPDDNVAASEKPLRPRELHRSTFGISSDPLTQFAVVFAALIHDVDHTGLSNSILVEKRFAVARIFQNKSVAEQNSVVVAWDLLMQPRFSDLQNCIFPNESDQQRFRQLLINAVMATDIMDRDMVALRKKRWEKAFDSFGDNSDDEEQQDFHRKATIVIEHLIQASDVAHTMQHWHIYLKWNARLYKELYRSYKNGFLSKDPTDGWYEGELGFFDYYVIPLAKKLKDCGVFNVSGDEYLQYAEWNRQEWEQKGREETRNMVLSREDEDDLGDFSFALEP